LILLLACDGQVMFDKKPKMRTSADGVLGSAWLRQAPSATPFDRQIAKDIKETLDA